jgi:hypothetical protein
VLTITPLSVQLEKAYPEFAAAVTVTPVPQFTVLAPLAVPPVVELTATVAVQHTGVVALAVVDFADTLPALSVAETV